MIQQLLIGLFFAGAIFYLGYSLYKHFTAKEKDCGGSCGCSKVDLEKIEKELSAKQNQFKIKN